MSNQETATTTLQIITIGVCYKADGMTPNSSPRRSEDVRSGGYALSANGPKIDPENVTLGLAPIGDLGRPRMNLVIRKEEVQRLSLMVGDTVTIRLSKAKKSQVID